jgi:pSer/pThr/pTyr-binding forkhead associated (FHA) protein
MGKLVVSLDGVVIKEVQITKDKTTLGRRPYNDIVIDNLAVSGEHAVLQMVGADVFIEDLNSTNGTYINGKAVKKQLLTHNDTVEIGKYKIKYLVEDGTDYEKTMIMKPGALPTATHAAPASPAGYSPTVGFGSSGFGALGSGSMPASIRVLNGAAAGREVNLTKVVTTVGKPGVQVASITKRPGGYVFAHVEGALRPTVNGHPLTGETVQLKNGDVIELAGTQMQFVQL